MNQNDVERLTLSTKSQKLLIRFRIDSIRQLTALSKEEFREMCEKECCIRRFDEIADALNAHGYDFSEEKSE